MTSNEKFWYLIGPVIMAFTYAATYPTTQVYFVSIISPKVLAASNLVGTALSAFVNWTIPQAKMKEWYRNHFLYIVLVDIICFFCFSFYGLECPEIRFIGFSFLNAVSTCLWVMVMRNTANRIIVNGDKRTDFDALNEFSTLIACFCGAATALIFNDVPVEYCITAQCVSNLVMGITDLYSFNMLSRAYGLDSNTKDKDN